MEIDKTEESVNPARKSFKRKGIFTMEENDICVYGKTKRRKTGNNHIGTGEKTRFRDVLDLPGVELSSVDVGKACFTKLISPVKNSVFFKRVWEKKPLCVTRKIPNYYENVCSMDDFKSALANMDIRFTENIDVTTYQNGVKVTESHVGRATPKLVMGLYNKGRSIRLLNPQTFIKKVRCFTTELQEYFRCFVGSNIYLTPGNSQGFAPHYDDVEAFVLQLAGRKEWRVYNPRPGEELPRFSSGNFVDGDIGEPIIKVILEPGDLLYFPRGIIHQAKALDEGSMHITVSCYQRNSYADFLEKILPVALQTAISEDVEFRKGLPLDYLDHTGMVSSDNESGVREKFVSHVKSLVNKLCDYLPVDSCADQFGKNFVHDAMPPILHKDERAYMAKIFPKELMEKLRRKRKNTLKLKLIRGYACRLVCEEERFKLYYNTRNGLTYHEVNHRSLKLSESWAMMVEILMKNYPKFTDFSALVDGVGDESSIDDALRFVEELTKRRLLFFDK